MRVPHGDTKYGTPRKPAGHTKLKPSSRQRRPTEERAGDMPATKKADCLRTFIPMFIAMRTIWDKEVQDMLDKADKEASEMESDLGE